MILIIKLSFKNKTKSKIKNTILFVWIENAWRRQMAQVLFRKYAPADYYDALIAGTKHTSEINPIAIKAMSHIGINIINKNQRK